MDPFFVNMYPRGAMSNNNLNYQTKVNPYTGLTCSLPSNSTEEQWEKQFQAQKIMLDQLALLEDDED